MTKFFFLAAAAVLATASSATAQVFDESMDGDLSFTVPAGEVDPISPATIFNITAPGALTVVGSSFDADQDDIFSPGGAPGDFDVFGLNIASGLQIDSVTLNSFDGGGAAFIGLEQGTSLSLNPTLGPDNANFPGVASGLALVDIDSVGEILDDLNSGALGNVPGQPLAGGVIGSGDFVFSFQNTGTGTNTYSLTFNTSAVPEPGSGMLLGLALVGMVAKRRRR